MAVTINPVEWASFGVSRIKPLLPRGWSYIERPDHWRIAQSPDGEYWYAGESQICRLRFASNWDVLRSQFRSWFNEWITPFEEGDHIADTRKIIDIASL